MKACEVERPLAVGIRIIGEVEIGELVDATSELSHVNSIDVPLRQTPLVKA